MRHQTCHILSDEFRHQNTKFHGIDLDRIPISHERLGAANHSQGVTGTIRGTWAINGKTITLKITSAPSCAETLEASVPATARRVSLFFM